MKKSEPTLPSNRTFVVQFRTQPQRINQSSLGRMEHVVTGQVMYFDSWKHLQGFIERTLTGVSEKPP